MPFVARSALSQEPWASSPTTPSTETEAPRAASSRARFAAPPGRRVSPTKSPAGTGASRASFRADTSTNLLTMRSPMTSMRLPWNLPRRDLSPSTDKLSIYAMSLVVSPAGPHFKSLVAERGDLLGSLCAYFRLGFPSSFHFSSSSAPMTTTALLISLCMASGS